MGRHAEHQSPRTFKPFLNLRRNAVTRLDHPFIEPDLQAVCSQPFCYIAYDHLILRAMTQKNVKQK